MNYKYLTETTLAKIDDDGISRSSCSIENPEYLAWLAEGNTPEPADPLPLPTYTCSPWQIRKALNQLGIRDAVEQAVSSATGDGAQTLKDGWEFATEFRSDDPFVISMGAALGLDDAALDQLFAFAASV
jgi:hypothetical protein